MKITSCSRCCVTTHSFLDYVPIASTVTGLVHLTAKHAIIPCLSASTVSNSQYLTYLNTQPSSRSVVIALLPFLGNLIAGLGAIQAMTEAQEAEDQARASAPDVARERYCTAAKHGSVEGVFQVGCMLSIPGTPGYDLVEAQKCFRWAAARGHEGAYKRCKEGARLRDVETEAL